MKKLCALILAITASVSVFASSSFLCTEHGLTDDTTTSVINATAEKPVDDTDGKIITYICNKNTKKFHLPNCYTLPKEKNRVYISSYERAIKRGFKPCKNCMP